MLNYTSKALLSYSNLLLFLYCLVRVKYALILKSNSILPFKGTVVNIETICHRI